MSRLVTFGCSFTYGTALPDKVQSSNASPSRYAWPSVLGKLTKMQVCNKATPASSNLEILCELLRFDFEPDDTVIIMWTLSHRDLFFTTDSGKKLTVWSETPLAEELKNAKEIDYVRKTWLYIHHADLYLKSKNINYIHYPAAPHEIQELQPDYINDIDNIYWTRISKVDEAADNEHPGVESHKLQAVELQRLLDDLQYKS